MIMINEGLKFKYDYGIITMDIERVGDKDWEGT